MYANFRHTRAGGYPADKKLDSRFHGNDSKQLGDLKESRVRCKQRKIRCCFILFKGWIVLRGWILLIKRAMVLHIAATDAAVFRYKNPLVAAEALSDMPPSRIDTVFYR